MNINFFQRHIFHIHKYISVRGFSIAVNEIFVHMNTHLSNRWISYSIMSIISYFIYLYNEPTNVPLLVCAVILLLFTYMFWSLLWPLSGCCVVFTSNLHLFMSQFIDICVFMLTIHHHHHQCFPWGSRLHPIIRRPSVHIVLHRW